MRVDHVTTAVWPKANGGPFGLRRMRQRLIYFSILRTVHTQTSAEKSIVAPGVMFVHQTWLTADSQRASIQGLGSLIDVV